MHPDVPGPALSVEDVRFAYQGRPALDGVGFTVEPGRFTALLGPNGAGKSTLFAIATGLLQPQSGRVRVLGHDLARDPVAALGHMGVVFQQPTLDLDLSVVQNLRYFAALHGIGRRAADDRIEVELTRLAMFERRDEKVRKLNGGHRRRVEIARALLHRPALLLLDEPTVGLDLPTRRALIDHVHDLARNDGIAVLWATHLIDEIDPATDRVVVLHRGTVRASGTVLEVNRAAGAASITETFDRLTGGVAA
ncbi:MAG TPA: ABC transporter ATP-binding protein [Azospirillum sp.]|nr:ABC transporter ATP-binding protein [Azospirillum sp.]